MHCQQGGDDCEGKVLLDAFRGFQVVSIWVLFVTGQTG
jgi:hypothetical protein